MSLETNVFRIVNLAALSSKYKLYRIKGLNNAPDEYYQNRQNIIRKLSFSLKAPVTIIDRDGVPHLVVSSSAKAPPNHLPVIRTNVTFELCPGEFDLDYTVRTPDNDRICTRFLDFWLQGVLFERSDLWQPGAGKAFFRKSSEPIGGGLVKHVGFAIRSTITPTNELGFCVDVTSKITGRNPLPVNLSHDLFAPWKNKTFVYHYGHSWYEIQAIGLSDQNVTEYIIADSKLSVLEWAVQACRKPIPAELAEVPHDASVVLYLDNRGNNRSAIAPLCYPVYRTSNSDAGQQHGQTILAPHIRRELIHTFVNDYLQNIRLGTTPIELEKRPISVEARIFSVPDIRFGNGKILSARSTPNTQHVSLDALGQTRLGLLKDRSAGFYTRDPLDRQYFILPQSVADSYGSQMIEDLKRTVGDLFPHEYNPVIVTYNDRVAKTFAKQGNAILEAVRNQCTKPGYAVVMIHHHTDRQEREEDRLAAMVIRELYEDDSDHPQKPQIYAAVIHTKVGAECYIQRNGESSYEPRPEKRGKLAGYLRMVAINKILLTNQRWPFVLETRLNADLTIGLDVKQNTAGLVIVGSNGGNIRTLFRKSNHNEKLSERQMKARLVEIIRLEAKSRPEEPIRTILLQRDGRIYDTELKGAHEAIDLLKKEGVIAPDATLTIIEVSKSAPVRFRLIDMSLRGNRVWVENPQLGSYCIISDTEGYLCSTGRAFPHKGTVQPLHIRLIEGRLSVQQCLEDVFYLSCLTWTRPEDSSRYPITIKLNDRFLSEEATDYDDDALDIEAILSEEDEMEEVYD